MTKQSNRRALLALAMITAFATHLAGCKLNEQKKANEQVEKSNELFEEAGELTKKGDEIKRAAVDEPDPDKRQQGGKKCKAKYEEATEKLEEAADIIKDASKLNVSKEFSEYLTVKSKQLGKVSEAIDAHGQMCAELSKEPDREKVQKLIKEAKSAMEEANELSEKAEEIREDHPDKFAK
jgi:tetratricopeptide (TPR) repeat protein